MPLVKCPTCAALLHIRPADAADWKSRHPGPEPASEVCFLCWGSLVPGQKVRVRWLREQSQVDFPGVHVGDVGAITRVSAATADGAHDEYRVTFSREGAPGFEATLQRKELHRVMEAPVHGRG